MLKGGYQLFHGEIMGVTLMVLCYDLPEVLYHIDNILFLTTSDAMVFPGT